MTMLAAQIPIRLLAVAFLTAILALSPVASASTARSAVAGKRQKRATKPRASAKPVRSKPASTQPTERRPNFFRRKSRPPVHLALGRTKAKGGVRVLDAFAKKVGGVTWDKWGEAGIVDSRQSSDSARYFRRHFNKALNTAVRTGGTIHFDLTHVDVEEAFRRPHNPGRPHYGDITEWELRTLAANNKWLERSVFYRRGRRIANQQAVKESLQALSKDVILERNVEFERALRRLQRALW